MNELEKAEIVEGLKAAIMSIEPKKILEGGGKHRRHIKVFNLQDVVKKRCEPFLRQACRI